MSEPENETTETDAETEREEEAAQEEETEVEQPTEPPEDLAAEVQIDVSERAIKARDKTLDKEHKRHEGVLERAFGSQWADFSLCPLCEGPGFMMPLAPGTMPDAQFQAVTAFAGRVEPVEYQESSFHERCGECDGRGETISGAQPPLNPLKLCDACSGNGYVSKKPALPTLPTLTTQNGTEIPVVAQIPSYGSPAADDAWGRPAGHPHYGIAPAMVAG